MIERKITNSTVLVTGAAGFIGSNLVEDLLKHGNRVIGLDNFLTGKKENVDEFSGFSNYRFIEGDIRNLDVCKEVCKDVDYVLHQAALGSVPRSIDDPITTNDVNVNGFLNMLVEGFVLLLGPILGVWQGVFLLRNDSPRSTQAG